MSEIITETIDQTAQVLPNCWVARSLGAQSPILNSKETLVLPSGKSGVLRKHILELIDGATEMLALCSFLLADSEIENTLLDAADRGVRVYMMIASEARLDNSGDDEFTRSCVHQHKDMLKKMGGKALIHTASHFHAKFIISDPKLQSRKGILLTANLTQEAIERNEELGVVLTENEIQDLSRIFKFGFWELSEHQMMDSERFQSFKPLNAVEYPSEIKKIPTTNAHSHSLKDHCLNVIQRAKKEIVVSSFGWDLGHEVVNQLCQRSRDGIQVRVLARMRESAMPALVALVNAGAQVYGFKWLHAKALWNDSGEALVMSANMQKDGLDQGFETGVVISGA